jgi:hypothetical protein
MLDVFLPLDVIGFSTETAPANGWGYPEYPSTSVVEAALPSTVRSLTLSTAPSSEDRAADPIDVTAAAAAMVALRLEESLPQLMEDIAPPSTPLRRTPSLLERQIEDVAAELASLRLLVEMGDLSPNSEMLSSAQDQQGALERTLAALRQEGVLSAPPNPLVQGDLGADSSFLDQPVPSAPVLQRAMSEGMVRLRLWNEASDGKLPSVRFPVTCTPVQEIGGIITTEATGKESVARAVPEDASIGEVPLKEALDAPPSAPLTRGLTLPVTQVEKGYAAARLLSASILAGRRK